MREPFIVEGAEGASGDARGKPTLSRRNVIIGCALHALVTVGLAIALAVVATRDHSCAAPYAPATASVVADPPSGEEKYGTLRVFAANPVATPPGCPKMKAAGQRVNQKTVDLIKSFEGWSATYYIDAVGIKTIGYGHACHAQPCPWTGSITKAQGEEILRGDLVSFEACVGSNVKANVTRNQFGALVSFAYNLGCGTLKSSTLLKKLNAGDYGAVPAEMNKWVNANGGPLPGLVRRRKAEGDLFTSTDGCESAAPGAKARRGSGDSPNSVFPRLSVGATSTATNRAVPVLQYLLANFLCVTPEGAATSDMPAFCPPSLGGVFDSATRDAVLEVQQRNGLYPRDGVANDDVWNALINFAGGEGPTFLGKDSGGSSASSWAYYAVRGVQDVVHRDASGAVARAPTGSFDAQTDVAVRAFQQSAGVKVDGIVGPVTWAAIANAGFSDADTVPISYVPPDGASSADVAQLPDLTTSPANKTVRIAQHLLCFAVCPSAPTAARCVPATGAADAATATAALAVQQREGLLPADGSLTRSLMLQLVRYAPFLRLYSGYSTSPNLKYAVMAVQAAVGATEDGFFGPLTESAVRSAQSAAGIASDGIVGPVTWAALLASGSFGGCRPRVTLDGVSGLFSEVTAMLRRVSCECFGGAEVVAMSIGGVGAAQKGAGFNDMHRAGRAVDFYVPSLVNETSIEGSFGDAWTQLYHCGILTQQWESSLHGANSATGATHIHMAVGPSGYIGRWLAEGVATGPFASPRGIYRRIVF